MSKIELITHPHAMELLQARTDYAVVCNTELIENPFWYEDKETGQLFYDLYACLGWPSEVTDSSDGQPGYAAIVGVVRPNEDLETNDPLNADFQLLDEVEDADVPSLLTKCLKLREDYGFGIHKDLLNIWFGDPERFLTTLALRNERLRESGGEAQTLLVGPPDDFYVPKIFDMYVRALRSVLLKDSCRFYFGYNDILQNKLREFHYDDPCVMAIGGLVHSLLCRCRWMSSQSESAFTIEDENDGK